MIRLPRALSQQADLMWDANKTWIRNGISQVETHKVSPDA